MSTRKSYTLAVLILLVAAGLRLWNFATLPPGLHEDQITDIYITEHFVRQGRIQVFYDLDELYNQGSEGREGLYHMALATNTLLIGDGLFSYHILSLWMGLLTVALTYALVKRLFGALAGVAAMALLAFNMWAIQLSRGVGRETIVPLLVTAILFSLASALSVRRRTNRQRASTTAFATLGLLLGLGFHIHPVSLMITLASMVFILYMLFTRQPMSRRSLSYIGFAILLMVIISIPYLISSLRLPELAATGRIFGDFHGFLRTLGNSLVGIIFEGDKNPAYNLPGRPLIDLVSGLLVLVGIATAVRYWRKPRFALPITAAIFLVPTALLVDSSPNFPAYSSILPILALFFGLGVSTGLSNLKGKARRVGALSLFVLLGFNLVWVTGDLFVRWSELPEVQETYHSRISQLARHIDFVAEDTPVVLCVSPPEETGSLPDSTLLVWMINREDLNLHYVNCEAGLVLAEGGEQEYIILPEPGMADDFDDHLRDWLALGDPVIANDLPPDGIIVLEEPGEVADAVGRFITMSPAGYAPEVEIGT